MLKMKKLLNPKAMTSLAVFITVLAIDQYTKDFFIHFLLYKPGLMYHVNDILEFVFHWNYGISFGLFSEYSAHSNIAFLCINCFIVIYLIYIAYTTKTYLQFMGLVVIISGAIGNLFDRVFKGAVFDFIYVHYDYHGFPAFNVADLAINIGVFMVILDMWFARKKND